MPNRTRAHARCCMHSPRYSTGTHSRTHACPCGETPHACTRCVSVPAADVPPPSCMMHTDCTSWCTHDTRESLQRRPGIANPHASIADFTSAQQHRMCYLAACTPGKKLHIGRACVIRAMPHVNITLSHARSRYACIAGAAGLSVAWIWVD